VRETRGHAWLFLLPLIVLWLVPVIAFLCLVPLAGSLSKAAVRPPAIALTKIGSRTSTNPQAVDITVALPPATTVTSSADGTVTSVAVKPGDVLKSGSLLITVDDVGVLAYVGSTPLYRDLSYGDRGPDISRLSSYLTDLGLLAPRSDGTFYSYALKVAASALERRIGATVDGQFHLSSIAFIPADVTRVGGVDVQPGTEANGATEILDGLGQPSAIRFAITGSEGEAPSTGGQPLTLSGAAGNLPLTSLNLSPSDRVDLYAYLLGGASAGALTESGGASSPTFSGAVLSDSKPQRTGVVPSSALFSSSTGKTCVFVTTKTARQYHAVQISTPELISGELGEAGVPISLAGQHVVRDPLTLPRTATAQCG
jgi:hypothetical protein